MGQATHTPRRSGCLREGASMAALYLEFCAARLDQLEACIARHDTASVSEIAHALRGNARCMGLSELASLGGQLEEYCLGSDWGAIESTYQAITETIDKLCTGTPISIPISIERDDRVQTLAVRRVR